MAQKTFVRFVKLQILAGKATPAPPVGPALGAMGINIMGFCKEFNARTQDRLGQVVPVVLSLFSDKSFTLVLKKSPVSKMILAELGIESGSKVPNKDKVGTLTLAQLKKIAEAKMEDLRVHTIEAAMRMVAGTARSMGVLVEGAV
jgi:large subunit ribosomal protein L11